MAEMIIRIGSNIDKSKISNNRLYLSQTHSNWILFNNYIKIYFEIYATLPGTEIILDDFRRQIIFDLLNRKNMGLGP